MAADGSVYVEVQMDTSKAEKELGKLKKEIASAERGIAAKEARKSPLEDEAQRLNKSLREARAQVSKYGEMWAQGVVGADRQQSKAQETLQKIENEYADVVRKIDKIDEELQPAYKTLEKMKGEAGELAQKLGNSASNSKKMEKANKKASKQMGIFATRLRGIVLSAFVFNILAVGFRSITQWVGRVIKSNTEAQASIAKLKGALLTMAQPILDVIVPALIYLLNVLTRVVSTMAQLFAMMSGTTVDSAKKSAEALHEQTQALDGTGSAAKDASKSMAGFDEINKLSGGSSGGAGTSDSVAPDFSFETDKTAGELQNILGLVTAIGSGFLAWKIGSHLGLGMQGIVALSGAIYAGIVGILVAITFAFGEGENLVNGFKRILDGFIDFFVGVFSGDLDRAIKGVGDIFGGLQDVFDAVLNALSKMIESFFDWLDEKTGGRITFILEIVKGLLNTAISTVKDVLGLAIDFLRGAFEGLVNFLGGVFTGDWDRAWSGIVDIGKSAINLLIGAVEVFVNFFVRAINAVIDGINSINVDVPDWVPGFGGQTMGFDIPRLEEAQIPRLAQGAVIPPNREFMAVLGDQKSGTNIETPLSTMVQAFRMAMREEMGGQNEAVMVLDDEVVGRLMYRMYNRESKRVGTTLAGGMA